MKEEIKVNGLSFVPYITRQELADRVAELGTALREDLKESNPVFLCVLNGSFMFAADLIRETAITDATINFVRYSSYDGTKTTGDVKQIMGLTEDIEGKDVVIIEDIVDTGLTATRMIDDLKKKNPRSIRFVTLLHKPDSSTTGFIPDYAAFKIPAKFIIGYGLDLNGKARNLKDIYVIKNED